MNISENLSPQVWTNYLRQIEISQPTREPCALVLCQERNTYQVLTQTEITCAGPNMRKLSLAEIFNLSQMIFFQAQRDYEAHAPHLTARELIDLSKQIFTLGERLMATQESKSSPMTKKVLQGLGWTIEAITKVSSLTFYRLRGTKLSDDLNHESVHPDLREVLLAMKQSKIVKEVSRRLDVVPKVILETQKDINLQDLKQFIAMHMVKNITQENTLAASFCLPIFAKDMSRGVTFLRKDRENNIFDLVPIPPQTLDISSKVRLGIETLLELTQNEKDKHWRGILQVAATQTSLTALFNSLKAIFIYNITSDVWQEGNEFKSLVFDFSEDLPPVSLEIIRDLHTGEINEVKIEVQAIGDILKKSQSKPEELGEVIVSKAIVSQLNYSVFLNHDHLPTIENIAVSLTCNF